MFSSGWRVEEPSRPKQQGIASGIQGSRQKRSPGVYRADRQGLARPRLCGSSIFNTPTPHSPLATVASIRPSHRRLLFSRDAVGSARLHNASNMRCFKRPSAAEAETLRKTPNSCERFQGALLALCLCRWNALRSERNRPPSDRRPCISLDLSLDPPSSLTTLR